MLASSSFYARELARRIRGDLILRLAHPSGLDRLDLLSVLGPEVNSGRVSLGWDGVSVRTIIWAEPERDSWQSWLSEFDRLLPPDGSICILGTTWLRYLLPEWQAPVARPAGAPLSTKWPLEKALRQLGFRTQWILGFQSPLSLLWGTASRFPAALGRNDLVDRCFAGMRRYFMVRGRQACWTPLWAAALSKVAKRG